MSISTKRDPRWAALALIVTAQFMVILDVAIVNVALPSIKSDLELLADEPPVGHLGLRHPLRRRAPARRPPRRPARTAPALHRRTRALRRELAAVRAGLVGGLADRLPRAAGARRRPARPGRPLASDHDLRGGPRAQPRARDLRRRIRQRCRRRRPARRPAHLVPELVVDLLHQRAGRHRRDRARPAAAAREPRRHRPSPLRRPRRRLHHRRADAARLRDDPRHDRRLGRRHDARPLRAPPQPSSPRSS